MKPRGFILHIVPNEDQLKWDPLFELAAYASTQFEKYILEKILKTQSLKYIPYQITWTKLKNGQIFK